MLSIKNVLYAAIGIVKRYATIKAKDKRERLCCKVKKFDDMMSLDNVKSLIIV